MMHLSISCECGKEWETSDPDKMDSITEEVGDHLQLHRAAGIFAGEFVAVGDRVLVETTDSTPAPTYVTGEIREIRLESVRVDLDTEGEIDVGTDALIPTEDVVDPRDVQDVVDALGDRSEEEADSFRPFGTDPSRDVKSGRAQGFALAADTVSENLLDSDDRNYWKNLLLHDYRDRRGPGMPWNTTVRADPEGDEMEDQIEEFEIDRDKFADEIENLNREDVSVCEGCGEVERIDPEDSDE